ncbi:hypothetical protein FNV43_RR04695 [Rhamnella rubrinervis]|uniref:Phosphoinositide phospholipase C n=1 Tax=Rhamnella rubrinervis TaxID=2594499 RepID=A0A8K0HLI8_9ROSA|nr:hypothetical protein FNV43_RR04695 [Rhamnella rubrinervis]
MEKKQSKQTFKVCFCFTRRFKFRTAEPPNDVKELFKRYSDSGTIMTVDGLLLFLNEVQGETNVSKEDAQNILNTQFNIFQRNKGFHLDAFFKYLLGDLNLPHVPKVHQDMTAPLAHYFLFTGHNSYLTGNQLSSDSSTVPIINALKRGVKVIELDLWPNSKKDDVEVRHGGTLTSPVKLLECLSAIREHAFDASEFPVVITFEDHLPPILQAKVAKMVTDKLGDMLYCPQSEYMIEFPSPDSLRKRIMISTKPPEIREHKRIKERQSSKDSVYEENLETKKRVMQKENEPGDEDDEDDDEDDEGEDNVSGYKQLIAIHAGKPKGELNKWLADPIKVRRLSLSEQELENATKNHGTEIVRFTQRNLLRIYPKGMRLDSSNYDPMLGWMHGAQMVAFNMQGHGKYLWIMEGMFKANGGCGYVKKPDFLLNVDEYSKVFNRQDKLQVQTTLKVMVYMGEGWHHDFRRTHFDQFSPPDFFARVGIHGVPEDTTMKKTKAIEDQWVPVWNEEFEFPLTVPQLAMLRIEVKEFDTTGNHDFGGQTCLPVSELRTGIRAVPLHDRKGQKYKSVRLLMRFQFV